MILLSCRKYVPSKTCPVENMSSLFIGKKCRHKNVRRMCPSIKRPCAEDDYRSSLNLCNLQLKKWISIQWSSDEGVGRNILVVVKRQKYFPVWGILRCRIFASPKSNRFRHRLNSKKYFILSSEEALALLKPAGPGSSLRPGNSF